MGWEMIFVSFIHIRLARTLSRDHKEMQSRYLARAKGNRVWEPIAVFVARAGHTVLHLVLLI